MYAKVLGGMATWAPLATSTVCLDSIFPECILQAGSALKSWFWNFLTSCIRQLKIPRIWRKPLIVTIPKPVKPLGDPKSYRPISLLCVPFKIHERLIYNRVELIIDPLLPLEQAGFRSERLTVHQVTLLTQGIEDSFSAKKAGAISQQPTTLYGIVASPASCCTCYLIQ